MTQTSQMALFSSLKIRSIFVATFNAKRIKVREGGRMGFSPWQVQLAKRVSVAVGLSRNRGCTLEECAGELSMGTIPS